MHDGRGRRCGIILLGGAMYALMASFGWQVNEQTEAQPVPIVSARRDRNVPVSGMRKFSRIFRKNSETFSI